MNYNFKYIAVILIFVSFFSNLFALEPFWLYLNAPETGNVHQIIVTKNNKIYIASENGIYSLNQNSQTWENIIIGINSSTISISSKNVMFSVFENVLNDTSLFTSFDSGKTWKAIGNPEKNDVYPYYRIGLIGIDTSENVYVYDKNRDTLEYFFASTDYGKTWIKNQIFIKDIKEKKSIKSFGLTRKDELYFFAQCSLNDSDTYWILGLSRDKGLTWLYHRYDIDLRNNYYFYNSNNILNKDTIIIFNGSKLQFTLDGGITWNLNDVPIKTVDELFVTSKNNIFIKKEFDTSIYFSSDFGANWKRKIDPILVHPVNFIAEDTTGKIYICSWGNGIYYTANNGNNWERICQGFTSANIQKMVFDSNNNIYVTCYGVYKSTDNGSTGHFQILVENIF